MIFSSKAEVSPPRAGDLGEERSGTSRILWISLLGLWLGVLVTLWWRCPGWYSSLSPLAFRAFLLRWGIARAACLYFLLYVFSVRPFVPLPPKILTITGGLLFGPLLGTCLAVVAATGNACVTFLIGKYLARNSIEKYAGAVLRHADKHVRQAGFRSIFLARVFPTGIPFDVISYAASMTPVGLRQFALGTLAGVIPAMAVNSYFGHLLAHGWVAAATLPLTALCGGVLLLVWRRHGRLRIPN